MPTQQPAASPPTRRVRRQTIGDLRRIGAMLEFVCVQCWSSRLFDPHLLPFGDQQFVVTTGHRMKCSFCGRQGDGSFTRTASSGQVSERSVFIGVP